MGLHPLDRPDRCKRFGCPLIAFVWLVFVWIIHRFAGLFSFFYLSLIVSRVAKYLKDIGISVNAVTAFPGFVVAFPEYVSSLPTSATSLPASQKLSTTVPLKKFAERAGEGGNGTEFSINPHFF